MRPNHLRLRHVSNTNTKTSPHRTARHAATFARDLRWRGDVEVFRPSAVVRVDIHGCSSRVRSPASSCWDRLVGSPVRRSSARRRRARKSTGRAVGRRFDALRGGDAYGQRHYEGVHGDAMLKAHAATFLLTKAPPRVDPGGEILDDDVRNSDVAATILHWLGADYADLRGTPRGVGLERVPLPHAPLLDGVELRGNQRVASTACERPRTLARG